MASGDHEGRSTAVDTRSPTQRSGTKPTEGRFEIGGETILAMREISDEDEAIEHRRLDLLESVQVRLGTFLKTETVSFLLGAGVSVSCGGSLLGSIPPPVELNLCGMLDRETVPRSVVPQHLTMIDSARVEPVAKQEMLSAY